MFNSGYTDHNPGDLVNNRYQITKALGKGAFGWTYIAKDLENSNQNQFVLKQLKPMFTSPSLWETSKQLFANEANVLKNLGYHPQIPSLLDYFEEDQQWYIVQEYIDGQDLGKEIIRELFDERKVIEFLQDALEVLKIVHQHQVIHRDIKPTNLMRRSSDNKVILIDFGAVKELTTLCFDDQTQEMLTKAIGTQGYWPPEQQQGNPRFNSDIFALGRTAIQSLTGEAPLSLENSNFELSNWRQLVKVSDKLAEILNKMMCSNYRHRYQEAQDVLDDLQPLLKIGQTIGERYQFTDYLGGSMWSHTYLGVDKLDLNSPRCVIKQLQPYTDDVAAWKEAQARFQKEFRVLQQLGEHEQIPELYHYFQEKQDFYLVQEYIDGDDLNKEIKSRKRLDKNEVISILKDVLKVLDFIHKQNIIHRDIKPSNLIQRRKDGKIFVIDFGLVKEILTVSSSSISSNISTKSVGTEGYMPPEQLAKRPTFASDIYALGTTAIEALTGLSPQEFPTDQKTGKLLWRTLPQIDKNLAIILEKMVSLDLKKRYNKANQIIKDLDNLGKTPFSDGIKIITNFFNIRLMLMTLALITIPLTILFTKKLQTYTEIKSLVQQGNKFYEKEEYQQAIEQYNAALAIDPRYYEALINRGVSQGKLGKYHEMRTSCDLAITIQKDSTLAWNCKGVALINLGQYPEAIKTLDQGIALNNQESALWINKAEALLKENQFEAALKTIRQAIELLEKDKSTSSEHQQDLATAWSYRGWGLQGSERFFEAREAYDRSLEYNPDYFDAQFGRDVIRAILLWKDKDKEKAIEEFDKIFNNPDLTDIQKVKVLYYRGRILCELSLFKQGVNNFDEAIKLDPNNKEIVQSKNSCK